MKKHLLLAVILLAACQETKISEPYRDTCPQVQIMRNESYLTQYSNYQETFQISISGVEGFCYYEDYLDNYRAVITPIFKIKRLRPSDETDVRFSYYTETVKGPPEYLGKKTQFVNAHIGLNEKEVYYKAPEAKVFVPLKMVGDYDINLGLWISPSEKQYNQKTFDINYRYIEE